LWFEHDLYDQLQLLQILDRLSMDIPPRVTAVPDDRYLTSLPTSEFHALFGARRVVTSGERSAARDAWIAFRSDDPRGLVDVLPRVTVLPHMAPALKRHLEQFPSLENGLSRTEQQTFEVMAAGDRVVRDIYLHANHDREEAVFMGDAAFLFHIGGLFKSPRPLLRSLSAGRGSLELDDEIELTDDGHRVLSGELDRITVHGIDRWLGGVHLRGPEPLWRWDRTRQVIRLA
jgi:hypothetical protein